MTVFTGSCVALVTPFQENGDIDYQELESLIEFQIESGTDAILIAGTTGEASTLTDEEQAELIRKSVEIIDGRLPVLAGAGSNDTTHGINLARMCEESGADALLLVTPYYNKTSQRGLVAHYKKIAEAVSLPIILYDVPGRTGMTIAPQSCQELAQVENIVGIKDATGNLGHTCKIAEVTQGNFDIYSGNDDVVLPLMSLGGKGVISVWANVFPKEVHDMCQYFLNGEMEKAQRIQVGFKSFIDALFVETNPIPVKAALEIQGKIKGHLRLPLVKADELTYGLLEKELERAGNLQ